MFPSSNHLPYGEVSVPLSQQINHPCHRVPSLHLGIHLDIGQQRGIYEDVPRIESLCLTTSTQAAKDHRNSFGYTIFYIESCLYRYINGDTCFSNIFHWLEIFILQYIYLCMFLQQKSEYFSICVPSKLNMLNG